MLSESLRAFEKKISLGTASLYNGDLKNQTSQNGPKLPGQEMFGIQAGPELEMSTWSHNIIPFYL